MFRVVNLSWNLHLLSDIIQETKSKSKNEYFLRRHKTSFPFDNDEGGLGMRNVLVEAFWYISL